MATATGGGTPLRSRIGRGAKRVKGGRTGGRETRRGNAGEKGREEVWLSHQASELESRINCKL